MNRREALKLLGLTLVQLSVGGHRAWAALTGGSDPKIEIVRGTRVMMGNVPVTISVVASDRAHAREAIAAAFAEMQRIERLLSVFTPASEFSRINAAAGEQPVRVSPETLAVIRRGREIARLTGGAFDMAMGPATALWDFLGKRHVPTPEEIDALKPLCRSEGISIDETKQEVLLHKKGMALDPGGIGKGYLAECGKQILLRHGITAGIIATAGDLVLFGARPDGAPWRVAIQHPRHRDAAIATLTLTDCAVSTSGDYERFFTKDGVTYHHLLDPKTILPARECQSVTVISDEGTAADAIATGAFVMGPARGMALLTGSQNGNGIVIDRNGGVHMSEALVARVQLH